MKKELSETKDLSLCMDNTHRIFNAVSQRGGMSSLSFKGTQRLAFPIPKLVPFQREAVHFYEDVPALNYIKYAVKSMPGTPKFENVLTNANIIDSIRSPGGLEKSTNIDFSGNRMLKYQDLLLIANTLISMKRNLPLPDSEEICVHQDLSTDGCNLRYKTINKILRKEKYRLLPDARDFQANVAQTWNTTFGEPTKMLLLPFSTLDEMKKDEAGGAALELYDLCNLVDIIQKNFHLVDGWNDRLIIEHGDQKTVENVRAFIRDIDTVQVSSSDLHSQTLKIRKLFNSTIHVPGAWHISLRMLCCIFKDHYATFTQPSQLCIGWKHIVVDPTDCYSQAVSLLQILYNQLSLFYEEVFKRTMMADEDIVTLECTDSATACIIYAQKFEKYLQSLTAVTDEVVLEKIHFYLKCRDFFSFRSSMRLGDSMTEDYLFDKWKSLWYYNGNHKYFSLCLDHIEMMHNLDPEQYIRIQISRHVWLNKGNVGSMLDKVNSLPVDELIEFYNDWVKRLPKVQSLSAFIATTMFTMVMRKCMHCFNENFGRYQSKVDRVTNNMLTKNNKPKIGKTSQIDNNSDDDTSDSLSDSSSCSNSDDECSIESDCSEDTFILNEDAPVLGKSKRPSLPRKHLESRRIFELLVRSDLHKIDPNRKLKDNSCVSIIPTIRSPLINKQTNTKKRKYLDCIEQSGILMNTIKNLLTETTPNNNDEEVEVTVTSKSKFTRSGTNQKKQEKIRKAASVKIITDASGTTRTLLFKLHERSENCCKDLFQLGNDKMLKDNICEKRKFKHDKNDRERKGYDELYERMGEDNTVIKILDAEIYQKLAKDTQLTPWRKNLR